MIRPLAIKILVNTLSYILYSKHRVTLEFLQHPKQLLWYSQLYNYTHDTGLVFITARKRSLGQGNVFTPVWHSFHLGGWESAQLPFGCRPSWGWADPPGLGRPPWMQTPWGWADHLDADPSRVGQTPPPLGLDRHRQMQTPLGLGSLPRYDQQAGGTHSTGVHTCDWK